MAKLAILAWVAGVLILGALPAPRTAEAPSGPRRPVALVPVEDGKLLFVANGGSGTIAVLDVDEQRTLAETVIGRTLADLVATPDSRRLLAVDELANELIVLSRRSAVVSVLHRVPVAAAPVSVRVSADGSRCFVASLWSRRLTLIDLPADDKPRVAKTVALPFAPRMQLSVRDKLVVADAFAGRLAVVDAGSGKIDSVRALPAHNIRGLALSADGKELLLTHQVLNPQAHTTRDDIHWGNVITNNLRVLALDTLLAPEADLLRGSRLLDLGEVGRGAGDPTGLAVRADGTMVIALSGTSEVVVGDPAKGDWNRLDAGLGPTAVALAGDRAFVANTFGDSVTIVDMIGRKTKAELRLGPEPPRLTAAERGERLFHDARLTHDGWFSCQSCHTDGHTNGLLADTLGDGSYGAPKRVPTLLGVKDTGPWAWNGSMATLRDQLRSSFRTTMRAPKFTEEQLDDLETYLRTLSPPPPMGSQDHEAVRRGRSVFEERRCVRCHEPPTFTTPKTYDVELVDEVGNRTFNPPSLRGVGQGGPYFHDGRAATLEEVFTRYKHELKVTLSESELADLMAYLRSI